MVVSASGFREPLASNRSAAVYGSRSLAAMRSTMAANSPSASTSRSSCSHERLRHEVPEPLLAAQSLPLGRSLFQPSSRSGMRSKPAIASTRSPIPCPLVATVFTIGGRHSSAPIRLTATELASIADTSRSLPSRSALLTTKMSAISMMPALSACTSSPRARHQRDDRDVGRPDDVDFVLAHANGLDDDDVLAGGVEDERGVAGRARESAELAACRHAPDEHAGIGGVRLHPQPVAQHGAAGEGAGRIDRDDADRLDLARRNSAASRSTSVLFPAPGGPVTPMRWARPVCAKIAAHQVAALGRSRPQSARWRAQSRGDRRPAPGRARRRRHGRLQRHRASSCRAITRRWISLVPSPIVVSLTSRKYFSAG